MHVLLCGVLIHVAEKQTYNSDINSQLMIT